ncbi:hypothetical protein GCM10025857_20780 [Alicyclobacillus contaminans]|uniref:helix-turn-helix domain-containing protein n=1 Tax=Alicyclobacillus contaminans TaxID=392016 RepID=UPI00047B883E|nr:hypothetical protein GCM10025857_20780 [Alicyclobacillus contaminans]
MRVGEFGELPYGLTVEEAQKILRVGRTKMYELCRLEDFPALRIGKRIVIPRDELFRWIKDQMGGRR